ncbi:hypothetical protein BaRGS_00031686, partial [Batillaria attramentaria]
MADIVAAAAAPVKTPRKAFRPKNAAQLAEHLKFRAMITAAIQRPRYTHQCRMHVIKYLMNNHVVGNDVEEVYDEMKKRHEAAVKAATLKQSKGTGGAKPKRVAAKKAKAVSAKTKTSPKKAAAKLPKTAASAKPTTAAATKPKTAAAEKAAKPKKPAKRPARKAAKPNVAT